MFKVGDRIVYRTNIIETPDKKIVYPNIDNYLKLNNTYVIKKINFVDYMFLIDDSGVDIISMYNMKCFISLKEYRKQKFKKIELCSK